MSKRNYRSDIDLHQNQILQAVLENKNEHPANPKQGQVYWNTEDETAYIYKASSEEWNNLLASGPTKQVVVKDKSQLLGNLRSDVVYVLDGFFNLAAGEYINFPSGNLAISGFGFDVSGVTKDVAGESIFKSVAGGSGNLILKDATYSSGAGSVFDIKDVNGNNAIEFNDINFSNCASLGKIDGYRQFTGTTCGFYGCDDGLELIGSWNGFKLVNTNSFGFGNTGTLFKKGANLEFSNRFYLELNFDFPIGAVLCDFVESNFLDNELFQINSTLAKVNGLQDDSNAEALIPNLEANNPKCLWRSNSGLPDTADEKMVDVQISGEFDINWLKDTYVLEMTADTTFTESNLPASGKNTGELKIYLSGDFVPTFLPNWELNKVGTFKAGEINEITLKFLKNGVYFMKIDNSLTVYPAPDLESIKPVSLLPNQTQELTLIGSFFTPATFVTIENQTVNSVKFVNSSKMILSVTTSETEGEFNVIISNGTTVVFVDALIINLGVVHIPTENDWTILDNPINVSETGNAKLEILGDKGIAECFVVDGLIDWEIRFLPSKSPINSEDVSTVNYQFRLLKISDNSEVLKIRFYGIVNGQHKILIYDGGSQIYNAIVSWDDVRLIRIVKIGADTNIYIGNTLLATLSTVINFDTKINISLIEMDILNIKYIELPTT